MRGRAHRRTSRTLLAAGLLLAGALAALGSSRSTPPPRERLIDEPAEPSRTAPRETTTPAPGRPYPACPAAPGTLTRSQLQEILGRGPGVFLGGLEVTMVRARALPEAARRAWPSLAASMGSAHGFGGWRLERFHPGDPCLARTGLSPGDVVVSVNGNALRRPGDLVSLWAGLKATPHLVVRLVRRGEPLTFVVRVVERAPQTQP